MARYGVLKWGVVEEENNNTITINKVIYKDPISLYVYSSKLANAYITMYHVTAALEEIAGHAALTMTRDYIKATDRLRTEDVAEKYRQDGIRMLSKALNALKEKGVVMLAPRSLVDDNEYEEITIQDNQLQDFLSLSEEDTTFNLVFGVLSKQNGPNYEPFGNENAQIEYWVRKWLPNSLESESNSFTEFTSMYRQNFIRLHRTRGDLLQVAQSTRFSSEGIKNLELNPLQIDDDPQHWSTDLHRQSRQYYDKLLLNTITTAASALVGVDPLRLQIFGRFIQVPWETGDDNEIQRNIENGVYYLHTDYPTRAIPGYSPVKYNIAGNPNVACDVVNDWLRISVNNKYKYGILTKYAGITKTKNDGRIVDKLSEDDVCCAAPYNHLNRYDQVPFTYQDFLNFSVDYFKLVIIFPQPDICIFTNPTNTNTIFLFPDTKPIRTRKKVRIGDGAETHYILPQIPLISDDQMYILCWCGKDPSAEETRAIDPITERLQDFDTPCTIGPYIIDDDANKPQLNIPTFRVAKSWPYIKYGEITRKLLKHKTQDSYTEEGYVPTTCTVHENYTSQNIYEPIVQTYLHSANTDAQFNAVQKTLIHMMRRENAYSTFLTSANLTFVDTVAHAIKKYLYDAKTAPKRYMLTPLALHKRLSAPPVGDVSFAQIGGLWTIGSSVLDVTEAIHIALEYLERRHNALHP